MSPANFTVLSDNFLIIFMDYESKYLLKELAVPLL
nr:MAG TPA: hypothetical protein [Caudoviricetes sp.]